MSTLSLISADVVLTKRVDDEYKDNENISPMK